VWNGGAALEQPTAIDEEEKGKGGEGTKKEYRGN
jgi:hypothetical protein